MLGGACDRVVGVVGLPLGGSVAAEAAAVGGADAGPTATTATTAATTGRTGHADGGPGGVSGGGRVGAVELGRGLGGRVAGVLEGRVGAEVVDQRAVEDRGRLVDAERRHLDRGLAAHVLAAHGQQEERVVGDAGVEVDAAVVGAALVALRVIVVGLAVRGRVVHKAHGVIGVAGGPDRLGQLPGRGARATGAVCIGGGGHDVGHRLVERARLVLVDQPGLVLRDRVGQLVHDDVGVPREGPGVHAVAIAVRHLLAVPERVHVLVAVVHGLMDRRAGAVEGVAAELCLVEAVRQAGEVVGGLGREVVRVAALLNEGLAGQRLAVVRRVHHPLERAVMLRVTGDERAGGGVDEHDVTLGPVLAGVEDLGAPGQTRAVIGDDVHEVGHVEADGVGGEGGDDASDRGLAVDRGLGGEVVAGDEAAGDGVHATRQAVGVHGQLAADDRQVVEVLLEAHVSVAELVAAAAHGLELAVRRHAKHGAEVAEELGAGGPRLALREQAEVTGEEHGHAVGGGEQVVDARQALQGGLL